MRHGCILGLLVVLLVGCAQQPGGTAGGTPGTDQPPAAGTPIPTWDSPGRGEPGEAAELRGVLRVSDGCLWVLSDRDTVAVQWPRGYSARFEPPALLDEHGEVVAREGDQIVGSGGQHEVEIGQCQMGERAVFRLNHVEVVRRSGAP